MVLIHAEIIKMSVQFDRWLVFLSHMYVADIPVLDMVLVGHIVNDEVILS